MPEQPWWRKRNAEIDPRFVSPVRVWTREEIDQTYTDAYVDRMLDEGRQVTAATVYGWGMIIDYCTLSTRGRMYGSPY